MTDLDVIRSKVINRLCKNLYIGKSVAYFYNKPIFNLTENEIVDYLNSKTNIELVQIVKKIENSKGPYQCFDEQEKKLLHVGDKLENYYYFDKLQKELDNVKDNIQNTTDVINLFSDIDKNRNNTDEEIKKVNNRLDKVESTLEQILNLLQKS